MKTIFISIPWFHPAYKAGGPVQSIANLVAQYHPANVQFKIYCANTDLDGSVLQGVAFDEWTNYNAYTQVWYASKKHQQIPAIKKIVAQVKPDIVFINGIYSGHFNVVPLLFCKASRKIISVRGMLHPGALSQKSFKKKCWLFCWKLLQFHRRYQFHATNEEERSFIQDTFGSKATIFVAANFPRAFSWQPCPEKISGHLTMVSIGLISPMKNYLLVLQALQHCTENIEYHIYGPVKDNSYWQSCLQQVKQLPANISVIYQGDIAPQNVEKVLANYQLFILPSKSENFGHAIYEALSAGKPVITSNYTPWNNLQNRRAGINVDIVQTNELVQAIQFFAAMPPDEFTEWTKVAHQYAINSINLGAIAKQYDELFLSR